MNILPGEDSRMPETAVPPGGAETSQKESIKKNVTEMYKNLYESAEQLDFPEPDI